MLVFMRFFLPFPLSHTLKNLPSRFRGPHPTFERFFLILIWVSHNP
eukprot:SAG22_NODE_9310_length_597_cov_0.921687_1_plen_45_part_01